MRRALMLTLALLIPAACGAGAPGGAAAPTTAAAVPSPTAAPVVPPYEIASAGRIRVAVIPTDPGIAWKDPASGELTGVNVDIARALARRFGVELRLVDMATYPAMAAALKAGTIDMVLVTPTPDREVDLDFTQPLVETDLTFLAPPGSTFSRTSDIDKTGVRIAVRKGTSSDVALSQTAKLAELVRIDGSLDDALAAVRAGRADVVAGARSNLAPLKAKLPGAVVLADRFGVQRWAIAVAKGKRDLLQPVAQFAKEIADSEFVSISVIRSGAAGVQAAMP